MLSRIFLTSFFFMLAFGAYAKDLPIRIKDLSNGDIKCPVLHVECDHDSIESSTLTWTIGGGYFTDANGQGMVTTMTQVDNVYVIGDGTVSITVSSSNSRSVSDTKIINIKTATSPAGTSLGVTYTNGPRIPDPANDEASIPYNYSDFTLLLSPANLYSGVQQVEADL